MSSENQERSLLKANNFPGLRPPASDVRKWSPLFLFFVAKYGKTHAPFISTTRNVCDFYARQVERCALIMRRVRSGARSCVTGVTALLRGFPSFLWQPCRAPRRSLVAPYMRDNR